MRVFYTLLFVFGVIVIIGSFVVAINGSRDIGDNGNIFARWWKENKKIVNNQENNMQKLTLISSAFGNNGKIPSKHTCDGEGISPAFQIKGVDENAKSLVLIMDDPDAPSGVWDHWVKFNISTSTTEIKEGNEPEGISGIGTSGNKEYFGPCPPDKEHRYFFKLFSLDTELDLKEGATKKQVEKAMEGRILQQIELIGLYERN
ncbi:MAG: YbhB/YbcL family Raf kinase inhibitor-like protein [Patescibacteria group bacterium]